MSHSSDENSVKNLAFTVLDFEQSNVDEILHIQTETGLSFWSENDYLEELNRKDSIFKIVRDINKKVVGFALVRLLVGNSDCHFQSSEILNIAISNSFQNKGIGQQIFNEILRELKQKNISEIWLEVRRSNTKALEFYKKHNFKFQFERKNYYTNPSENACVFRLIMN